VERIALVVNYDIPYDTESYVHRIGRTGRAGRAGRSILFVTPRQKRMLRDIERYTGQAIQPINVPTRADIAARRIALFKEQIAKTAAEEDLDLYLNLVEELVAESELDMAEVAAAAACLARSDRPLEVVLEPVPEAATYTDEGMVRLFIDAGRRSGVRPGDIVGAIANEAGVPGSAIGAIDIYERYSFVDIPQAFLQQVLQRMDGVSIRSRDVSIRVATPKDVEKPEPRRGFKPRGSKKIFPKKSKKAFRKSRP
jgi:ATP-dependent RNA helicase DeaD